MMINLCKFSKKKSCKSTWFPRGDPQKVVLEWPCVHNVVYEVGSRGGPSRAQISEKTRMTGRYIYAFWTSLCYP